MAVRRNRRVKLWLQPGNELPWRSEELIDGRPVRMGGAISATGAVDALNFGGLMAKRHR